MMDLRKKWVDAKKQVKTKDWEKAVRFRDDFGPNLDGLGELLKKVEDAQEKTAAVIDGMRRVAKTVADTRDSYASKVIRAAQDGRIKHEEADLLVKAMDFIGEFSAREVQARAAGLENEVGRLKVIAGDLK
jgi:hypothetical protein